MKLPQELTDFPKWKEGDGLTEFHFMDMPPGERCSWSCRWHYAIVQSDGRPGYKEVGTLRWQPSEMSDLEILCELQDISLRKYSGAFAIEAALLADAWDKSDLTHWRFQSGQLLNQARQTYAEYDYQPNPPKNQFGRPNFRPGWDELFAKPKEEPIYGELTNESN